MRMMVDQYLAEHMQRKLTLEEAAICQALHHRGARASGLDDLLQLYGGYGYMMEYRSPAPSWTPG